MPQMHWTWLRIPTPSTLFLLLVCLLFFKTTPTKLRVGVGNHASFPTSQLLLLELSFFDKHYFSVKQDGVTEHYKDLVIYQTSPSVCNRNKKTVRFLCSPNSNKHSKYPAFLALVNERVQVHGNKPKFSESTPCRLVSLSPPVNVSKENNMLWFLATVQQNTGESHTTLNHDDPVELRNHSHCNCNVEVLPWITYISPIHTR